MYPCVHNVTHFCRICEETMSKNKTIKLPNIEFSYLVGALRGLSKQSCKRSNCGTVCLCDSCAARRVLKFVDN